MKKQTTITIPSLVHKWIILGSTNIALGIILWIGLTTDYSWNDLWANIFYPPVVGLIGITSIWAMFKSQNIQRWLWITCLPSLLGGLPFVFILIYAVLPSKWPLTLEWLKDRHKGTLVFREKESAGVQIYLGPSLSLNSNYLGEVYAFQTGTNNSDCRFEAQAVNKRYPFIKTTQFIYYRWNFGIEECQKEIERIPIADPHHRKDGFMVKSTKWKKVVILLPPIYQEVFKILAQNYNNRLLVY